MMQASPEYRLDEQSLDNMFVRNGAEMAPVSQFVTLKKVLGPETTNRFNLYSSIAANVNPAEGYSSGEVQKAIEEVAEQVLPTATDMNTEVWLVKRQVPVADRRFSSMPFVYS